MLRHYTRTLFVADLTKALVEVSGIDEDGEEWEVKYNGIQSWDIVEGGEEAEEIERLSGQCDINHNYLVLHLLDGSEATFNNSEVAMFIF